MNDFNTMLKALNSVDLSLSPKPLSMYDKVIFEKPMLDEFTKIIIKTLKTASKIKQMLYKTELKNYALSRANLNDKLKNILVEINEQSGMRSLCRIIERV